MSFLVAHYLPTALFSLKDSQATNAAGKTLLVPSPYAVKLALIDVAAKWRGVAYAKEVFGWLRPLEVRAGPPKYACVTNSFIKIQRPPKRPEPLEPFKPTIAFREYAQFVGELRLAFEVSSLDTKQTEALCALLVRINYFGKRGCFMQWTGFETLEHLDASFVFQGGGTPVRGSVLHYLEDVGPKSTWEMVNVYDDKKPSRALKVALLPYERVRSSKRSTLYRRT